MKRLLTVTLTSVGVIALSAPAAFADVPQAPGGLPAAVDDLAEYEGASTCDVVQPGTEALRDLIRDAYGQQTIGMTRACPKSGAVNSEHHEGRALDWMLDAADPADAALAQEFLTWLLGPEANGESAVNARRLGVMYVIWDNQVWKSYRADQGWQPYTGANPHTDHIHVSLSHRGGAAETSWWTGQTDPLDGHWVATGGAGSRLGNPTSEEYSYEYSGGEATAKNYDHGTILWSEDTQAHSVLDAIAAHWFENDLADEIGLPVTDEYEVHKGGRASHFETGSMYWSQDTGAHEVRGDIRTAWAQLGWENSALGFPTSDEYDEGDGRRSDFQGGYVTWTAQGGAQVHLN
ncbi:LGFP repeat-containing protein [Kineococcus sp. SYSU DK003]|uniref:LGFP repeat-containing protein n=1 Tax=Kineococcus sp. SYSU DK003 TaxID=3383124 RepID=UPI003D7DD260